MRRNVLFLAIVLAALAGVRTAAAEPDELKPFAFLVGEWPASGSGQPGSGTGTSVFRRDLQDRVILRTSFADYPAANGKPASRHDDVMVLYA